MNSNEKITVLQSINKNYIDENMDVMLSRLGDNINFDDNKWICNNANNTPELNNRITIYYNSIPEEYRHYAKYYAILSENKLNTKIGDILNIGSFLRYIKEKENCIELSNINQAVIERYRKYLDSKDLSKGTKVKKIIAIADFFFQLEGWEGLPKDNPVNKRSHIYKRKKSDNELKTRYIPDNIMNKIDKIFFCEDVPIHFRLYYWICRLYPSRSSEISALKIDCIKRVGDAYVLFKSEEKSSNSIGDSNLVTIYIKYENMGKYLVDLYEEQRKISEKLKLEIDDKFKNLLFLYNPISRWGIQQKKVCLLTGRVFNRYLKKICEENGINKEIEDDMQLCVHSLRHIATTDRLYEKFSTIHIRDLTGHKTDSEVIDSYHHRKKNKIEEIQRNTTNERFSKNKYGSYEKIESKNEIKKNDPINSKVIFRGRIMNIDENREKKILSNKRAYRIGYSNKTIGLCTDILSCKSGVFDCFKCDEFAPDADEIEFFRKSIIEWDEEIEYYEIKGNMCMVKRAKEMKELFENIVNNIECLNGDNNYEGIK